MMHMSKNNNCPTCGHILYSLFYLENKKENGKWKRKWKKIEALYCKECAIPTIVQKLEWFNGE